VEYFLLAVSCPDRSVASGSPASATPRWRDQSSCRLTRSAPFEQDCFVVIEDCDLLLDGCRVILSADYCAKLQSWLDSQPRPRPQWAPEAPALEWAGQVGEVMRSHKSTYLDLTLYHVRFSATKHLDGWYMRDELEIDAASTT
jgi:hypothetical protein